MAKRQCTFPGYKCSICYAIFSVWGVLTLLVLGIFVGYRGVNFGEIKKEDVSKDRTHIFVAAAIYAACVFGCGARWAYLHFVVKKKNPYHPALL